MGKRKQPQQAAYSRTHASFVALIDVSVVTNMILRISERLHAQLEQESSRVEYVPPASETDTPEIRALVGRRRAAHPLRDSSVWQIADQLTEHRRRFRQLAAKAAIAADLATLELDSQSVPPLQRTAISIKRALMRLVASVPSEVTAGWAEPHAAKDRERILAARAKVDEWIEELRLLVQPPHVLPPPSTNRRDPSHPEPRGGQRAPRGCSGLTTGELDILEAMLELDAVSADGRRSAVDIAERATGDADASRVKNSLARMGKQRFVGSKPGRTGGSWITPVGQKCLLIRRPKPD